MRTLALGVSLVILIYRKMFYDEIELLFFW